MTQEEKAKAYDEAIEKLRRLHDDYDTVSTLIDIKEELEHIFPELAESEDERIRKALIKIVNGIYQDEVDYAFVEDGISYEQLFSWLEKQGEPTNIPVDSVLGSNKDGLVDTIKAKPTFKVGFKVGDWIVDNKNKATFLISYISDKYCKLKDNGGRIYSPCFLPYKDYHHWTIQDAKDGDVLVASDKSLFIYDGTVNENGSAGFHIAFTEDMDIILNSDDGCGWEEKDSCHPATKEQRDLLFSKMKETGYEWNADKKKLNKIEQKPADNVEPIFNVGDKIQYSKGCGTIMTIEKIENGEYIFGNNMGHTTIENGNKWYLVNYVEQKPAWSEEDEKFVHGLIRGLAAKRDIHGHTTFSSDCIDITETINWLKSLKDRVQPQLRQEWSKEDERCINQLIVFCENCMVQDDGAKRCAHWLKSLRPQSQWKPSDEQIDALEDAIANAVSSIQKNMLNSLYNDLKKLKG